MKKYNIAEWQSLGEKLYGKNLKDWKFKCPACGKISSGREFKATGLSPDSMHSNCIGRYNNRATGCDWAAYGLFGTLGKGAIVVKDDGEEVEVFCFATEK